MAKNTYSLHFRGAAHVMVWSGIEFSIQIVDNSILDFFVANQIADIFRFSNKDCYF